MILMLIVAVLVLAAVLAVMLSRMRTRRDIRGRPVSMQAIWETWTTLDTLSSDTRATHETLLAAVDPGNRESVRQNLLDFEVSLHNEPTPMITVRQELMDSMDRRLLNLEILQLPDEVKARLRVQSREMMQTDSLAREYVAANDLRMALLREYAAQRFGDRNQGDWFDVYQKASRLKQKGARNFIQRTLAGSQSSVDDARYQTMTLVDHEIRTRLLKMPAGTQFPSFGPESGAGTGV